MDSDRAPSVSPGLRGPDQARDQLRGRTSCGGPEPHQSGMNSTGLKFLGTGLALIRGRMPCGKHACVICGLAQDEPQTSLTVPGVLV